jgi:diguanylate cyclase (GGDEF)-like protein
VARPIDDALRAIIRTQTEIAATDLGLGEIMELITEQARQLTRANAAVIELAEDDELFYAVTVGEATPYLGTRLRTTNSLSSPCIVEGRVLRSDDVHKDPRFNADGCGRVSATSMICAPLVHGEETLGVLSVYSPDPDHFDDRDADALELLGELIAAHMSHATVFGIESYDSRHDALTALPNLRAFEERLSVEVARTGRYERPLSLCLLDIDHFKQVNDRLGHPAGDEVLRSVARILDQSRLTDDCFRIGGDEFAVVMPDTTAKEARVAAARIAEQLRIASPGDGQLDVSFGVAGITDADPANLLAAAEGQLMAAKDRLYGPDREG